MIPQNHVAGSDESTNQSAPTQSASTVSSISHAIERILKGEIDLVWKDSLWTIVQEELTKPAGERNNGLLDRIFSYRFTPTHTFNAIVRADLALPDDQRLFGFHIVALDERTSGEHLHTLMKEESAKPPKKREDWALETIAKHPNTLSETLEEMINAVFALPIAQRDINLIDLVAQHPNALATTLSKIAQSEILKLRSGEKAKPWEDSFALFAIKKHPNAPADIVKAIKLACRNK